MYLTGPIIAIDDDEDDQFLLAEAIKSLGIANIVRFFSNGREALTYLTETTEKPFIILCDINMPVMTGIELAIEISQSAYLRKKAIPFIYMTTAASPDLVNRAYDTPVQGFYQKPADYDTLQRQLRLIVDYWTNCLRP